MRFWSKGLGKRCLVMDCGTESVRVDGALVVLSGRVKPPLDWAYTTTLDETDWIEFASLALHPEIVRYLACRRRVGLALRAGWHLLMLLVACTAAMVGLRFRRMRGALVPARRS